MGATNPKDELYNMGRWPTLCCAINHENWVSLSLKGVAVGIEFYMWFSVTFEFGVFSIIYDLDIELYSYLSN